MSVNRRITGEDGRVHLPGVSAHDSVTLCGSCWPDGRVVETDDCATCEQCLEVLRDVQAIGRLRRLRCTEPPTREDDET